MSGLEFLFNITITTVLRIMVSEQRAQVASPSAKICFVTLLAELIVWNHHRAIDILQQD
jgi:hypothetical protein